MKRALVLLAAVYLTGCSSLAPGPREAERYFILAAAPVATSATTPPLTVLPTTAANFYDTQDIVYSRAAGTRAYYQFSHWTERPQRAIHAQLVAQLGAGAQPGRLILATHLEEIYHDAAQPPGTAHLALTAQLIEPSTRAVLAQRRFGRTAAVGSYDADGAVAALRQALGGLLAELQAWVANNAPAAASQATR